MLSKLQKEPSSHDKLVVIDADGTADIATVFTIDDNHLEAESINHDYSIPLADCKTFVGPMGRIFVLQADNDYVSDTRRLAALEKSIVLRQVTQFDKDREVKKGIDYKQIALYALIGVLLLGVLFK